MTAPVVTHFIRQLHAEKAACGRFIINCHHRSTDPSKVTFRACIQHMTAPTIAAQPSTEKTTNA